MVKANFTEETVFPLSHERVRGEGEEFASLLDALGILKDF